MANFLIPRFRFGLYLVEQTKKYPNNNSQAGQPTFCYADSYEVVDGVITFYHTFETDDNKKVKAPVLTYPAGKWEACILFDSNNQTPVFNGKAAPMQQNSQQGSNNYPANQTNSNKRPAPTPNNTNNNNNINNPNFDISSYFLHNQQGGNNASEDNDLNNLTDLFADTNTPSNTSNNHYQPQPNNNNSNSNSNNNWNNNSNNYPNNANPNGAMPGVLGQNNPLEFKKAKNDFLEAQVKEYSRTNNSLFNVNEFLSYLSKNPKSRDFGKLTDTDVEWTVSKLLRDKVLGARKFSDPVIQKSLTISLPDIMKRQWSGKMAPIIQILQEFEETKNVNAIDLAVWMANNNFS